VLAGCGTAAPGQAGGQTASAGTTAPATTAPATAGPESSAPSPLGHCRPPRSRLAAPDLHRLTGVQFVSPARGWVAGGDRILTTGDGGAHWQTQDRGKLNLTSLDFISDSDGWAVGPSQVLATTDGGAHWRALPEPCPLIDSVHFASPAVGFAVAGGAVTGYRAVPPRRGVLLATGDGGRTWHRLHTPPDVQSACFTGPARGWLGAHGRLYRTVDGGTTWALAVRGVTGADGQPYVMTVQCAGPSAVWALGLGFGAATSHAPWLGYHAGPAGAQAVFAEQFFPHPGVRVTANAPGTEPGTLSAISASTAVVIGWCPPCGTAGYGTAPWDLLTRSGAVITPRGNVGRLTTPAAASFLAPQLGWVVGTSVYPRNGQVIERQRIVMTADGGRSWHIQYSYVP
jgi:photosystem II stability/assembly factor-like uncharacterized protein